VPDKLARVLGWDDPLLAQMGLERVFFYGGKLGWSILRASAWLA
jgi:hypothetical protein